MSSYMWYKLSKGVKKLAPVLSNIATIGGRQHAVIAADWILYFMPVAFRENKLPMAFCWGVLCPVDFVHSQGINTFIKIKQISM